MGTVHMSQEEAASSNLADTDEWGYDGSEEVEEVVENLFVTEWEGLTLNNRNLPSLLKHGNLHYKLEYKEMNGFVTSVTVREVIV